MSCINVARGLGATMRRSKSKILAASGSDGDIEAVRQLGMKARDVAASAIALLGSLTHKNAVRREYERVLKALAEAGLPAFYVPGKEDAPFCELQREAASFEVVHPNVRGVHGTFAMGPGHVVWSGMGGTIEDDPDAIREKAESLCYPGWEVEYRLKFLQELKDCEKVFLFTTSPSHKGLRENGSSLLAEIIKTHNPPCCAGRWRRTEAPHGRELASSGSGKPCQRQFHGS
jgi:Icc-related predicted phosphoesterase